MIAATHGVKSEAVGVLDFMPGDSLPWMKRRRAKSKGVGSGPSQTMVIKSAFGLR